ncbi:MAG: hypothetical protein WC319_12150 [Candidatus Paceibacterota bacterium]|jgi:hypothetical protein
MNEYLKWSYLDCWHELDNIVMRGVNDLNEAEFSIEKLKELVDRATPKKINLRHVSNYKGEISLSEKQYCPNCFEMIFDKKPKYCEHCGQALDWSEEK